MVFFLMTFFIFILMQILLIITKPWLIILMLQSKTMGNYLKTSSKNIQKFCSSVNFKYVVSLIQGCGFLLLNFLYIYTTVFILLLTGMINCVSFQKLLYHCLCDYYFWMMCYFFSHFSYTICNTVFKSRIENAIFWICNGCGKIFFYLTIFISKDKSFTWLNVPFCEKDIVSQIENTYFN